MVRWTLAGVFLLLALALTGCSGPNSPSSATPLPTVRVVSMAISGRTTLTSPGDSSQLMATATFSDGTSRDVTADAVWYGGDAITISGRGLITARAFGFGSATARYRTGQGFAAVRVVPDGAFLVQGSVLAQGGFRLAGATVQFSSRCGTHTTTTNENGNYVLPAEGDAAVRVQMEGFAPLVQRTTMERDGHLDFELQHIRTAGDLSGAYRLTVTASPSCTLPVELVQRSYEASVLEVQQDIFVILSGAQLVAWGGETGFTGRRDGSAVQFTVLDSFDAEYSFIEMIDAVRYLYHAGTAEGRADETDIVALFKGTLELRGSTGASSAYCMAADHRFELTRTDSQAARKMTRRR